MTFTIKDYNTLKSSFNQTLDILERREKKTDAVRAKQIAFLNDVIALLDKNIKDTANEHTKLAFQPSKSTTKKISKASTLEKIETKLTAEAAVALQANLTLYGAMAFIVSTINEKLGFAQGSLLRDRLYKDDMGINADNVPTALQYKNMYQQLNKFLQVLFNENQASQGIKAQGGLTNTETRTLVHWMRESYKHELSFFIDALPSKISLSQEESIKNNIKEPAPTNESSTILFDIAPFSLSNLKLPDWVATKKQLTDVIHDELAEKNLHNINALSNNTRRNQLNLLKQIEDELDASSLSSDKKSAILLGTMYIVREQISKEYNKGLLICDTTSSIIHQKLSQALGLDREYSNKVDPLVNMAQTFIMHLSLEETTEETQRWRNTHALSSLPQDFLIDTLKLSQKILYTSRLHALEDAYAHYKTSMPTVKAHNTSVFTFWNSKTPGTPKESQEAPNTPTKDAEAALRAVSLA